MASFLSKWGHCCQGTELIHYSEVWKSTCIVVLWWTCLLLESLVFKCLYWDSHTYCKYTVSQRSEVLFLLLFDMQFIYSAGPFGWSRQTSSTSPLSCDLLLCCANCMRSFMWVAVLPNCSATVYVAGVWTSLLHISFLFTELLSNAHRKSSLWFPALHLLIAHLSNASLSHSLSWSHPFCHIPLFQHSSCFQSLRSDTLLVCFRSRSNR